MLKIGMKFITRALPSKDFYNLLIIKIAIMAVLTHCVGGQAFVYPHYITDLSQQAYGAGAKMMLSLQTDRRIAQSHMTTKCQSV